MRVPKCCTSAFCCLVIAASLSPAVAEQAPQPRPYTGGELFHLGLKFLEYEDYGNAIRLFGEFLTKHAPRSKLTPAVHYHLARAWEGAGDLSAAATEYERILRRFGGQRFWVTLSELRLEELAGRLEPVGDSSAEE